MASLSTSNATPTALRLAARNEAKKAAEIKKG